MAAPGDGWLLLLKSARAGDEAAVRRLLSAGVPPDCPDALSGYTGLHYAASAGHLGVVRLLVEAGADLADRRNNVCQSALAGAVIAGQTAVVEYLLARGADPDERLYGDNRSLAEEAEHSGQAHVAELLRQASRTPRRLTAASAGLAAVLRRTRALLALPGNDFAWSSWQDASAALAEMDGFIAAVEGGQLPPRSDLSLLFAPTGSVQEVSLRSDWGEEFLALASRFDAAAGAVYGS